MKINDESKTSGHWLWRITWYDNNNINLVRVMSVAAENELVVMVPLGLLGVHARLHLARAVRTGAARADHAEPGVE